jgi:6-phosphofructokinase 1
MAKTSTKVFVLEVMGGTRAGSRGGRHGGGSRHADPARAAVSGSFRRGKFLAAVDAKVKRFGYCCVGVSEGVKNAAGD